MSKAPKVIRSFQAVGCLSKKPATSTKFRLGKMSMIRWLATSQTVVA